MPVFMRSEPGTPAEPGEIALCVPHLGGNAARYIQECLDTNFVSSVGPFVDRFERAVADYVGVAHAVATVNGTAALHVALLAAGVEPDDEVLVSALTFIAPVNAIRYAGAWPVFIDAAPDHWQMDPALVDEFLTRQCVWRDGALRNRASGRRVRAILPVHILGHPVDLDPVLAAAERFHLPVIEDATESLGARYRGRMVGHLGHAACFSFNGNKLITTGGGGMFVTDNAVWARRVKYLTTQAKDDPIEFVHNEVGFNYRLTNIQAALGVAQMEQVADFLHAKRRIATTYAEALEELPGLTPMPEAPWAASACWLYTVRVNEGEYGLGSRQLLRALAATGIQTRPLWQPVNCSPAHRATHVSCPVAERLNREALSLPCSVGLTTEQQARVVAALHHHRHHDPGARHGRVPTVG